MDKPVSHSTESVEEKLARERAEAREELKNADMGAFDRAIDALLKTSEKSRLGSKALEKAKKPNR